MCTEYTTKYNIKHKHDYRKLLVWRKLGVPLFSCGPPYLADYDVTSKNKNPDD